MVRDLEAICLQITKVTLRFEESKSGIKHPNRNRCVTIKAFLTLIEYSNSRKVPLRFEESQKWLKSGKTSHIRYEMSISDLKLKV